MEILCRTRPEVSHVAWDLDGTLYDETQYVFAAYRQFCDHVLPPDIRDDGYVFLTGAYLSDDRTGIFDRLEREFSLAGGLDEFLESLRSVQVESMVLHPGTADVLRHLSEQNIKLSVVTNGNPRQQRNKIAQLPWGGLEDRITFVFADQYARKPDPMALLRAIELVGCSASQTIMVGDADVDQSSARRADTAFVFVSELIDDPV